MLALDILPRSPLRAAKLQYGYCLKKCPSSFKWHGRIEELFWIIHWAVESIANAVKQEGHQSDITSKASLLMGSQPKLQPEHDEAQQEATESTEATELQGTSQWLRVPVVVASSSLSHSSHQHRPISVFAAVTTFWRRQVVTTIPENECQDHFGTETPTLLPIYLHLHIMRVLLTFRRSCSHHSERIPPE